MFTHLIKRALSKVNAQWFALVIVLATALLDSCPPGGR